MVDLLGEHAAKRHASVLQRHRRLVRDRLEQPEVLPGELCVSVDDELADRAPLPTQRHAHGVLPGATLRPRDPAVLEHDRGTRCTEGVDGCLHDRLERLLQVQRLGHRLGDPGERLELADALLRRLVEASVLDRLRHLRGDRDEEVDLRLLKARGA